MTPQDRDQKERKVDLQIVVHGQVNFFYWNEEFGDFKTFSIA
jgi:hypothetical protein